MIAVRTALKEEFCFVLRVVLLVPDPARRIRGKVPFIVRQTRGRCGLLHAASVRRARQDGARAYFAAHTGRLEGRQGTRRCSRQSQSRQGARPGRRGNKGGSRSLRPERSPIIAEIMRQGVTSARQIVAIRKRIA
jgi:hypothetical protein